MHWIKNHGEVLAACDEGLPGKHLKGEKRSIEIRKSFYEGRKVEKEELQEMVTQHDNVNLIGGETIKAIEETGMKLQIMKIKNVPHALIFKINK